MVVTMSLRDSSIDAFSVVDKVLYFATKGPIASTETGSFLARVCSRVTASSASLASDPTMGEERAKRRGRPYRSLWSVIFFIAKRVELAGQIFVFFAKKRNKALLSGFLALDGRWAGDRVDGSNSRQARKMRALTCVRGVGKGTLLTLW